MEGRLKKQRANNTIREKHLKITVASKTKSLGISNLKSHAEKDVKFNSEANAIFFMKPYLKTKKSTST
jgi:hypothetical protein